MSYSASGLNEIRRSNARLSNKKRVSGKRVAANISKSATNISSNAYIDNTTDNNNVQRSANDVDKSPRRAKLETHFPFLSSGLQSATCETKVRHQGNWEIFETHFPYSSSEYINTWVEQIDDRKKRNISLGSNLDEIEIWGKLNSDKMNSRTIDEIVTMMDKKTSGSSSSDTKNGLSEAMLKYFEEGDKVIINDIREFQHDDNSKFKKPEESSISVLVNEEQNISEVINQEDNNCYKDKNNKDDKKVFIYQNTAFIEDFVSVFDNDLEILVQKSDKEESEIPVEIINAPILKDNSERFLNQIRGATRELLETELTYIASLNYILIHYMPEINRYDAPPLLRKRGYYLFGHIVEIFRFHEAIFNPALMECNMDCQAMATLFINFEEQFYIYTKYALNCPRSKALMDEYGSFFDKKKLEIGDQMGLNSYFLKPLQRLIKYGQLLGRIAENFENLLQSEHLIWSIADISQRFGDEVITKSTSATLETLKNAALMLRELETKADEVQMIPFVYSCPIDLEASRLLMTGKLLCSKKSYKYQVFLFEDMIVFAKPEIIKDEVFYYKNHMMLSEMTLPTIKKNTTKFTLSTGFNAMSSKTIHLKASSIEERDLWYNKIYDLLKLQFTQIKQSMVAKPRLSRFQSAFSGLKRRNTIKLNLQGRLIHSGKVTIKSDTKIYVGEANLYENKITFRSYLDNIVEDEVESKNIILDSEIALHPTQFVVSCSTSYRTFILQANSELEKNIWKWKILYVLNRTVPEFEMEFLSNVPRDRQTFPKMAK